MKLIHAAFEMRGSHVLLRTTIIESYLYPDNYLSNLPSFPWMYLYWVLYLLPVKPLYVIIFHEKGFGEFIFFWHFMIAKSFWIRKKLTIIRLLDLMNHFQKQRQEWWLMLWCCGWDTLCLIHSIRLIVTLNFRYFTYLFSSCSSAQQ